MQPIMAQPLTIVDEALIAQGEPIVYVSGTPAFLLLTDQIPADHHVCGFVSPSLQGTPPRPVVLVAHPQEILAYTVLSNLVAQLTPAHMEYFKANAEAIRSAQEDYQRAAQEAQAAFQADAQAFTGELNALIQRGDPLVQLLLDAMASSMVEVLRLTGQKELNVHHGGVLISVASNHVMEHHERFQRYLNEGGADEALAEYRTALAEADTDVPPDHGVH